MKEVISFLKKRTRHEIWAIISLVKNLLVGPRFLLSGLLFVPGSEIRKPENQKIKNRASEMISVPAQLRHKSQTWEAWKTLSLKAMTDLNFRDAAASGTNRRNASAQELPIF